MRIVSACLLGIPCRYDGKSKINEKILELMKTEILIPVCPEQLGGFATPRIAAEQIGNKVFDKKGNDLTLSFENGANEVLKITKMYGITKAILKHKSPSCGSSLVYDGTFSGTLVKGDGVCSALLKKNKIEVISEEEL